MYKSIVQDCSSGSDLDPLRKSRPTTYIQFKVTQDKEITELYGSP